MGVQSNETRKQQPGHENAQRQGDKNREDFGRDNPNEANPQMRNKPGKVARLTWERPSRASIAVNRARLRTSRNKRVRDSRNKHNK